MASPQTIARLVEEIIKRLQLRRPLPTLPPALFRRDLLRALDETFLANYGRGPPPNLIAPVIPVPPNVDRLRGFLFELLTAGLDGNPDFDD